MNNQSKKFKSREELLRNLDWLYDNNIEKFYFIEAIMKAVVNKEDIRASISLNEPTHTVKVYFGEYAYKEEFGTLEEAHKLIDFVKGIKKIIN